MNISRQQRAAEDELLKAFSDATWRTPLPDEYRDCPSIDELHSFVRGKARGDQREYLVAHLASCDRCLGVLQKRRAQQSKIKEATLIFAVAVALLLVVWMSSQNLMQMRNQIATVDLRPFALTRGGATVTAAGQALAIPAKASRLRLILAAGSEGQYECEILDGSKDAALTHNSGETFLQDHQVILELPMRSHAIQAGQYTMGLRKQGHDWVFYPIVIK